MSDFSVKLVSFSCKQSDWDCWWFGFEARAMIYGYEGIMAGVDKVPTLTEYQALDPDSDVAAVKKKLRLFRLNGLGFSHVVSSIDLSTEGSNVVYALLRTCKTDEFPFGNLKEAVGILKEHFSSKSVANAQKYTNEYYDMILKSGEDPAVFVAKMQNLRAKIAEADPKQKIGEREFLLRVLNRLPYEYESTVELIEKDMGDGTTVPKMSDVMDKLSLRHQRFVNRKEKSSSEEEEKALYAGGFKGMCNKCGKYGHKGSDCTKGSGGGNDTDMSDTMCNYCKKMGHMKWSCPKLAAKNGGNAGNGGNGGNGGGPSGFGKADRADIVLVAADLLKLGSCYRCGAFGLHGETCVECLVGHYDDIVEENDGTTDSVAWNI